MIAFILALAAASSALDLAAIRSLRAQSNAAIAAHDFEKLRPLMEADFAGIPGSLGKPLPPAEFETRMRSAFADPTFVTYVRTPKRIAIAASRKRAAEIGTWIGTWRKPDGEMRLTGIYQAVWVPAGSSWKLRNESFVTLKCTGSRACADVE